MMLTLILECAMLNNFLCTGDTTPCLPPPPAPLLKKDLPLQSLLIIILLSSLWQRALTRGPCVAWLRLLENAFPCTLIVGKVDVYNHAYINDCECVVRRSGLGSCWNFFQRTSHNILIILLEYFGVYSLHSILLVVHL